MPPVPKLHSDQKPGKLSALPLLRYLFPFCAIALALGIQIGFSLLLPPKTNFPYAFFYVLAISLVAWLRGYVAGVAACLLTMIAIPPAVVPASGFPPSIQPGSS